MPIASDAYPDPDVGAARPAPGSTHLDLVRDMRVGTASAPPDRDLVSALGGKAAPLMALAAEGIDVPPGFVVTTAAFAAGVDALLRDADELRDAASSIRSHAPRVLRAALPASLVDAIEGGLDRLAAERGVAPDDLALAVRSSASDEDGVERSFAGQQSSVLGVCGLDALVAAITQVWSGFFAPDAMLYRGRHRLDGDVPAMAVLVQPMVDARVAGVLFTANPVTGARDEALVCAAWGLGETVVDGDNVDTWALRRPGGHVLRAHIGHKATRRTLGPDASVDEVPVAETARDTPCLTPAELGALEAIGRRIERSLGGPRDIEFAWAADRLVVLQARPVTAGRRGRRTSTGASATLYSNANVGEALPGVGTPMTWSVIHAFARRGFETAFGALGLDVPPAYGLVASFRGRVFLDISEFVSVASQIPLLTGEKLAGLAGVMDVEGLHGTYRRMSPATFLARLPMTVPRLVASQLAMPLVSTRWAKEFRRRREIAFAVPLAELDRRGALAVLEEVDRIFNTTGEVMLAASSNFLMSYVIATESLRVLGGDEAAARQGELFSGLTGVESAAPGLEVLAMARMVRASPELSDLFADTLDARALRQRLPDAAGGAALAAKLDAFLERWGHRAVREAEIATPRWREDPSFLIGVVRRHLAAPHLPTPEDIEREQAEHRAAVTQLVRRHFVTGVGLAVRGVLRWAQRNARKREELRALVVDTLSMYRIVFLDVGHRLVERAALAVVDDVFFLTAGEVRDWLDAPDPGPVERTMRRRVAFRRALHRAFVASPDPPDTFVLPAGQAEPGARERAEAPRHLADQGPARVIRGLPGSPGRVTGPARVVGDDRLGAADAGQPSAERAGVDIPVHPGEILVTSFTDVGWTPLFLVVSGVVTDRGGPLSHSCVVAREYGIPAVVGTGDATRHIRTGDIVTIDGLAGTVSFVPRAQPDAETRTANDPTPEGETP